MKNKIIPINDSMTGGYDHFGRKIIYTASGPKFRDENTHAEVTPDMKKIVRIFKQEEEPKVEKEALSEKPVIKRTRKKKES